MILLTHLGGDISIIEVILALIFKIIMMMNAMDFFRFKQKDLCDLVDILQLPNALICPNGTKASGIEALCLFLTRHSYPCRYFDLVPMFGRAISFFSLRYSMIGSVFLFKVFYDWFCFSL